jgi:hypothetical protein
MTVISTLSTFLPGRSSLARPVSSVIIPSRVMPSDGSVSPV